MDFLELAAKRYSVRKFKEEKVRQEDLDKILKAGMLAPTAHNDQPQRILVINSDEALEKLKPEAVFIELASRPCCDSKRLLLSPALPARTSPAAAARYIYDEIRPLLYPAADGERQVLEQS